MHIPPTGGPAGAGVSEAKLNPIHGQSAPVTGVGETTPAASTSTPPVALGDSAVIRELAVSDLTKLAQILHPVSVPELVMKVENLVHEAVHAIHEGRREWAVGRFIEAVTSDPSRVEELVSKPELAPIQTNMEQLLVRLTNVAKMDAETKLGAAEAVIESHGWQKLPHWETEPHALLQIGHRLLEAGGYANYVRTSDLATTLQTAYLATTVVIPPPLPIEGPVELKKEDTKAKRKGAGEATLALAYYGWGMAREKLPKQVKALWRRAPLLVILGTWFGVGLVGGVASFLAKQIWPDSWIVEASDFGFQLWGLGFLAIVGFGFWAQVRRSRR